MHSDPSNTTQTPQELVDDEVPRRRLALWGIAFAVMVLGLVLYFIYHSRVSPLLD